MNKKIKIFLFSFFACCSLFFIVSPVMAEGDAPDLRQAIGLEVNAAGTSSGLGTTDPRETAARIINYLLGLVGTLFVVLIVYAGYLWMTAGGEEQQIEKAKSYLKNGIIGLVIVLAAVAITLFVTKYLIRATGNQFYDNPAQFLQGGTGCSEEERQAGRCS